MATAMSFAMRLVLAGAGLDAHQAVIAALPQEAGPPAREPGQPPPTKARVDRYGDPLPPGVVARLGTERLTLRDRLCHLAFSADGRRLAAHDSEELRVWEVATSKELLRVKTPHFGGHSPSVTLLAFCADGRTVALGCPDKAVRLWQVGTARELKCLGGLRDGVTSVAFTPDGRYLLAGGGGGPVLCWDWRADVPPRAIGDFPQVWSLALSRDGKTLTVVAAKPPTSDNWVRVWCDLASGKEVHRLPLTPAEGWPVGLSPGGAVLGNAPRGAWWSSATRAGGLSPDGAVLARPDTGGKGAHQGIALLDPRTGRPRCRLSATGRLDWMSFSADGTALACLTLDGTARVWDTDTGRLRTRFRTLANNSDMVALSPGGRLLARVTDRDLAIHLYDVTSGHELHSFAGHRAGRLAVAFVGDGREVATTNRTTTVSTPTLGRNWADWSLRRWDAATGEELAVNARDPGEVHFATFSADGRRLVTVLHDGTLCLWDVPAGRLVRKWQGPACVVTMWVDAKGRPVLKAPQPTIAAPQFTADGQTLLAADMPMPYRDVPDEGFRVHRWEVGTGRELPAVKIPGLDRRSEHNYCVASPDGRTLAVWALGGRFATLALVDAATGKVRHRLPSRPDQARFSADGRTLATKEPTGICLWEVASGRSRGRLAKPFFVPEGAFSPDGRLLAAGARSPECVSLWDLATGEVVGRLRADLAGVESLSFSPDGSRLAVAGWSHTALVCDVAALCGGKDVAALRRAVAPSAREREDLWADLAGADGARAYRAIHRLAAGGADAATFLRQRLDTTPAAEDPRVARLIADLDNDDFVAREKASVELEQLGQRAGPALRRALEGDVSPEVRSRLSRLLRRLGPPEDSPPSPELVRLRVVEALEANGTAEARQILKDLAGPTPETDVAREAKASLQRLLRQSAVKP
jgi:WD40 repeat protein